jgi:hypothetical protein
MIFKLAEAARESWRRLNNRNQLPKPILGVKFANRLEGRQIASSSRYRLIPFVLRFSSSGNHFSISPGAR